MKTIIEQLVHDLYVNWRVEDPDLLQDLTGGKPEEMREYVRQAFRKGDSDVIRTCYPAAVTAYIANMYIRDKARSKNTQKDHLGAWAAKSGLSALISGMISPNEAGGRADIDVYRMGRELTECLIDDKPSIPFEILLGPDLIFMIELPEDLAVDAGESGKMFEAIFSRRSLKSYTEFFGIQHPHLKNLRDGDIQNHETTTVLLLAVFERSTFPERYGDLTGVMTREVFRDVSVSNQDPFMSAALTEIGIKSFHESSGKLNELAMLFWRCAAYILSGEPDIRHYRPEKLPENLPRKERDRWVNEHKNQSVIDAQLVGFDWKKPKIFSVDEVPVRAFWRWQPHGPGRTLRKWIFIRETIRRFKKN